MPTRSSCFFYFIFYKHCNAVCDLAAAAVKLRRSVLFFPTPCSRFLTGIFSRSRLGLILHDMAVDKYLITLSVLSAVDWPLDPFKRPSLV